jgi:small multidrug resistance pump
MEDYQSIEKFHTTSISSSISQREREEFITTNSTSYSLSFSWFLLFVAIFLEVAGTTSMKLSNGLTRLFPSIMIYIFYGLAFSVFPLSLKRLELSTAYAVWSGVGTIITAIIGFVWFHDTINWTKILALVAIVGGCVVLQFADDRDAKD